MRISNTIKAASAATAAVALAVGMSFVANADVNAQPAAAQSDDASGALTLAWTKLGVAPEVQGLLLNKLVSGRLLDAESGAEPVSETSTEADGTVTTTYRYADGSVATSTAEVPRAAGTVGTQSITSCAHTQAADVHTYKNCTVAWNAVTWSMDYKANYSYYQFGASISNLRALHYGGAGDFSAAVLELVDGTVTTRAGVAEAEGRVTQKLTVAGVGATRVVGVRLKVSAAYTGRKARESSFGS